MSNEQNPATHQDPRIEVLQAVYDHVHSWEESAPPEKIRAQLNRALDEAGIDVDDEVRDRIATHISERRPREDVADLL